MKTQSVKRIVSDTRKVGFSRIYIDTNNIDKVADAATRSDVAALMEQGIVKIRPKKGISNGRLKYRIKQISKDRRRGPGSLKGTRNARFPRKSRWIKTIRALRSELIELKESGKITDDVYRKYYRIIKSGNIRSRSQLVSHIKSAGLMGD
ncbi:MAG: 50S ribosomal protein L19e [Thermoplasmata archaeon]